MYTSVVVFSLSWVFALAALTGCTRESQESRKNKPDPGVAPAVAATVNGVAITREDFQSTLQHAEKTYLLQGGRISDADKARLSSRILEKMIQDELLIQHARNEGIRVTPEEVGSKLAQIKSEGGGEDAYRFFLINRGLEPERVRYHIERNMVIERLLEKMRATEKVGEEEIAAYLDEHKDEFREPDSVVLAHLLLRRRDGLPDPVQRAKSIREEIRKGLAFEKAVAKYSDDGATHDKGGNLGTLRRGEMLPALEQAAFSLQKNVVSDPVVSPAGVHLLKVLDKQPGEQKTTAEVRKRVLESLLDKRMEKQLNDLAKRLQKDAVVEIKP